MTTMHQQDTAVDSGELVEPLNKLHPDDKAHIDKVESHLRYPTRVGLSRSMVWDIVWDLQHDRPAEALATAERLQALLAYEPVSARVEFNDFTGHWDVYIDEDLVSSHWDELEAHAAADSRPGLIEAIAALKKTGERS